MEEGSESRDIGLSNEESSNSITADDTSKDSTMQDGNDVTDRFSFQYHETGVKPELIVKEESSEL